MIIPLIFITLTLRLITPLIIVMLDYYSLLIFHYYADFIDAIIDTITILRHYDD
jgi:hypothetical protein